MISKNLLNGKAKRLLRETSKALKKNMKNYGANSSNELKTMKTLKFPFEIIHIRTCSFHFAHSLSFMTLFEVQTVALYLR